ncbi:MAG: hypothetical protein KAT04_12895 [Methylococcales bacterium]|nr:hypothetical protein [Methylococcales bacterium]
MLRNALLILLTAVPLTVMSAAIHVTEAGSNDKKLIIDGKIFEAKTSCSEWGEGQRVMILNKNPEDACASATIYNMNREEKCEVLCK